MQRALRSSSGSISISDSISISVSPATGAGVEPVQARGRGWVHPQTWSGEAPSGQLWLTLTAEAPSELLPLDKSQGRPLTGWLVSHARPRPGVPGQA